MEILAFLALCPLLALVAAAGWILWKLALGLTWLLRQVLRFLGRTLRRSGGFARATLVGMVHTAGALVTAAAVMPLALVNLLIGRWEAMKHYARAVEDELLNALLGGYRLAIGNPLRFLGLGALVDGLEHRLPEIVDRAPRRGPHARHGTRFGRGGHDAARFPGYDVVGTLPSGGSGALLFVARPRPETRERLARAGRELPDRVVVKSFALEHGSTLPQIVRESRALEAASRLGLVLDHDLSSERFFYVTPYVEGDELDTVTRRLHARSGPDGLGERELALALCYAGDLLRTLQRFHAGGLWHKDVKPANVVVADGRAHLVDFGLVTPLASALTLTTHGTEYYRDPEMVRLAMQGVKVHEVDGVKFDLYSAGAVLFSLVEGSFPAHGSLSRISKRCPEALRWIVRRAMADVGSRYVSSVAMLADLEALASAADPFAVRPADLPSFRGEVPEEPVHEPFAFVPPPSSRPVPESAPAHRVHARRGGDGWPRRRHRRRVLAAAAVGGVVAVAALRASSHDGPVHVTSWEEAVARAAHVPEPRLYDHEREAYRAARALLEEDPRTAAARGDAHAARGHRGARDEHESSADVRPSAAPRPVDLLPAAARVLVLEDLDPDAEESVLGPLEEELDGRGFTVRGTRAPGPGGASGDDVALVAGARHVIGLGGLRDEDAAARLQRYLDGTPEIDAIVWLGQGDREGEHAWRVLVRAGAADDARTASVAGDWR